MTLNVGFQIFGLAENIFSGKLFLEIVGIPPIYLTELCHSVHPPSPLLLRKGLKLEEGGESKYHPEPPPSKLTNCGVTENIMNQINININ